MIRGFFLSIWVFLSFFNGFSLAKLSSSLSENPHGHPKQTCSPNISEGVKNPFSNEVTDVQSAKKSTFQPGIFLWKVKKSISPPINWPYFEKKLKIQMAETVPKYLTFLVIFPFPSQMKTSLTYVS